MPAGREARMRARELFNAMTRLEELSWSSDRRHTFPDGTCLQLEFELLDGVWPRGIGRTRAVLYDADGRRIDESEWFNDPQVRYNPPIPRLRAMVDAQLASSSDSN